MFEGVGKCIDYIVMIVSEYAQAFGLTQEAAFRELDAAGGIAALEENYEIEHTLPISSTVDALRALCIHSQGAVK